MSTPSDNDRYPTLSKSGQETLKFLKEHPFAPIFRNQSGNRLYPEDIKYVLEYESEVLSAKAGWKQGSYPDWLNDFAQQCYLKVPYFKNLGDLPSKFEMIPTVSRSQLASDISSFVPTDLALDRLINFQTTGVSGHPLILPSHPTVAACYLAFIKKALKRRGIELKHSSGQTGVVILGYQKKCFTYVSVTPTMGESGLVKLNLHPNDWKDPADRGLYLDALQSEVFTGDPISWAELLKIDLKHPPKIMLSTSMKLLPGLKAALEKKFSCLVLDLYSMNESGIIAVAEEAGHVLLQHKLYVEILNPDGTAVAPGQRGEIVITGGYNHYLPLLRYRTGDHASLKFINGEVVLAELEGRPAVQFKTFSAEWINNIDISHALKDFSLSHYKVHQNKDGSLEIWIRETDIDLDKLRQQIEALFGDSGDIKINTGANIEDKVIQYTSDLM